MPIELLKDSQFKYHINYYFQGNTTVWAEQDFCQKKRRRYSSDASVLQRSTKNICIYKRIDNNYIQTKSNNFFFNKNLKKKST